MAEGLLVKEDWAARAWEVNQDLLAARLSTHPLAHLDVTALEKYLEWLQKKERQC